MRIFIEFYACANDCARLIADKNGSLTYCQLFFSYICEGEATSLLVAIQNETLI